MEEPNNEPVVTKDRVLGIIIAVFGVFAVFALIWGMWKAMQVCFTIVFVAVLAVMLTPDDH